MQLFAFNLTTDSETPTWILILIILTGAAFFTSFLFWLIFRQMRKSRELLHLERMKSLEMGRSIGPSEAEKCQSKYLHNVFWICFWIGAVVPIAATSAASSVMIQTKVQEFGIVLAVWICVAVISIASVVCGTALMISSRDWASKGNRADSSQGA